MLMPGELAERSGTAIGAIRLSMWMRNGANRLLVRLSSFFTYFTKVIKLLKVFLQLDARA